MDSINKLTELFKEFPGIGSRQARRFVYYLLSRNKSYLDVFTRLILRLKDETKNCELCFRFFPAASDAICHICKDTSRDTGSLMIVTRDADLETIEKSHAYAGFYFVLGGTVPILEKEPEKKIRENELRAIVKSRAENGLHEIIIATSLNPEGENTFEYVSKALSPVISKFKIKVSALGRGLSTGTELEYSDSLTIENALKNRY